jgi:hypothetical protein
LIVTGTGQRRSLFSETRMVHATFEAESKRTVERAPSALIAAKAISATEVRIMSQRRVVRKDCTVAMIDGFASARRGVPGVSTRTDATCHDALNGVARNSPSP